MATRNWIPVRGAQGEHSRQAHADMPAGTYEREISKEGFFGPAAFIHHKRPPTGWVNFEGPLRPRAFDLNALNAAEPSPWAAGKVLYNPAVEIRFWKLGQPMPALARNADGDQLLFVHAGAGRPLLRLRPPGLSGRRLPLPAARDDVAAAPSEPTAILMIQATNTHFGLPDKGLLGGHALFDPAMLETPAIDEAFKAHQSRGRRGARSRSRSAARSPP